MAADTASSRSLTPLPLQNHTPPQTFLNSTPDPPIPLTPLPASPSLHSTWNSHHPCFPHRNPHVPANSQLFANTRIIRLQRDYMFSGDLSPAFTNIYPEILEPYIPEDLFREVVGRVNEGLRDAFDPWNMVNWADALAGAVTGFVWEELVGTRVKRKVEEVEGYLREVNRRLEGRGEGVRFVELRRCGFLNLDIQIPDPGVDVDLEDEDEEREEEEEEEEGDERAREMHEHERQNGHMA